MKHSKYTSLARGVLVCELDCGEFVLLRIKLQIVEPHRWIDCIQNGDTLSRWRPSLDRNKRAGMWRWKARRRSNNTVCIGGPAEYGQSLATGVARIFMWRTIEHIKMSFDRHVEPERRPVPTKILLGSCDVYKEQCVLEATQKSYQHLDQQSTCVNTVCVNFTRNEQRISCWCISWFIWWVHFAEIQF